MTKITGKREHLGHDHVRDSRVISAKGICFSRPECDCFRGLPNFFIKNYFNPTNLPAIDFLTALSL